MWQIPPVQNSRNFHNIIMKHQSLKSAEKNGENFQDNQFTTENVYCHYFFFFSGMT